MHGQRADLTRNIVGLHGSLYSSAACMTEDQEDFDAEDGDSVFETRNNLRRDDIAGDTSNKDVADGLTKTSSTGTRESAQARTAAKGCCFSTVLSLRILRSCSTEASQLLSKRSLPAMSSRSAASGVTGCLS